MLYAAIGIGIGFLFGVYAFVAAETTEARIIIVAVMAFIFVLPIVWRRPASGFVSSVLWMVFGIGFYVFLKWQGAGLR
jgi:hypothetical protein